MNDTKHLPPTSLVASAMRIVLVWTAAAASAQAGGWDSILVPPADGQAGCVSAPRQLAYQERQLGAFIPFGLPTYAGSDAEYAAVFPRNPGDVPDELHPNPLGTAKVIVPAVQLALADQAPVAKMAASEHDARMAWWREARFGLFLHFGLFSLPTEEPQRMEKYFSLPIEEFWAMKDRFNPPHYDPEQWVRLAKQAGMKYVVLVTKSHDGWCLFNSQYTDFDVTATPYHRDLLKPLAEACQRHGLKLCWYYSIIDWHQTDYLPRRAEDHRPATGADMDRYVAFMKNQLRELVTNYGPIGVIWFDGNWEPTWTEERGEDLYRYLRELQPDILVNNRVGKVCPNHISQARPQGDFDTPEQLIPDAMPARADWESCMTINNHWQYVDYDQDWKSPTVLIRMLIDIASKGGNLLLDVGPQPDGVFPPAAVERLEAIGRWMQTNGESIYGTKANPLTEPIAWGRCTCKPLADGALRLYLHVFDGPSDGRLAVPGLKRRVVRANLLADAKQEPLKVVQGDGGVAVTVPDAAPDAVASVVVLEVE